MHEPNDKSSQPQFDLKTLEGRKAAWAWLEQRFGKSPLVVTKDGIPFEDQAEGIRQFKEAALRSKQQPEWTPEMIRGMTYEHITELHNAALAAEQARCYNDGWVAGRESMEKELAAERQKREQVERDLERTCELVTAERRGWRRQMKENK